MLGLRLSLRFASPSPSPSLRSPSPPTTVVSATTTPPLVAWRSQWNLSRSPVVRTGDYFPLRKKGKPKNFGGKGKKGQDEDEDEEGGSDDVASPADFGEQMSDVVDELEEEFDTLRVGKADPSILETLRVEDKDAKGEEFSAPLVSYGQVNIKDGGTLSISVYDQSKKKVVTDAIISADLGMSPLEAGDTLLVPIPKPTKEFRAKLVRTAKTLAEDSKVKVRNLRRQYLDIVKKATLTKDEVRKSQTEIQKLHDDYIKKIAASFTAKEKELMK